MEKNNPALPLLATDNPATLPIGIFDSGVGGLTVLAALRERLPRERYLYLGDTARLPYGTKSRSTVTRYALQAAAKLVERHIKLLVVACNTAAASALPALQQTFAPLPVVGVVEPGAEAACAASKSGHIMVLATESTIQGGAYTKAIQAIRPEARIIGVPCSLFVALAEEGWMDGLIAEAIAARYLHSILGSSAAGSLGICSRAPERPDCIVLACTHFPPLAGAIRNVVGNDIIMVDSAATTALAVEKLLHQLHLLRPDDPHGHNNIAPDSSMRCLHFLTTDSPWRFARIGGLFLGMDIDPDALELVAL